ncbi:hypothetical protein KOW79_012431 [Hemibagrus wyckioides]|uniref:Uncharacterized protein n=1 Tax=Hemibagrus wyckioides TaxID=337641 RepID=A0A9D3NLS6_9TELE|nr:hypothetical protein KOW79_012431 [Hemibagrus wyckioides]
MRINTRAQQNTLHLWTGGGNWSTQRKPLKHERTCKVHIHRAEAEFQTLNDDDALDDCYCYCYCYYYAHTYATVNLFNKKAKTQVLQKCTTDLTFPNLQHDLPTKSSAHTHTCHYIYYQHYAMNCVNQLQCTFIT